MNNLAKITANSDIQTDKVIKDLLTFLQFSWKYLIFAGIVGAILGFGWWFFLNQYKSNLLLTNNNAFTLIAWKKIEKFYPLLAREMLNQKAVPENYVPIYQQFSEQEWWNKNIAINFALTKIEAKEILSIKSAEDNLSDIISFSIILSGHSKENLLEKSFIFHNFLSNAAAYISVREFLTKIETHVQTNTADLQNKIYSYKIALQYLKGKLNKLEQLQKRYPFDPKITMIDPKENISKYLPLETQIVAVNVDIASTLESIEKINDKIYQLKIYKNFVDEAVKISINRYDGLAITDDFLKIQEKKYDMVSSSDLRAAEILSNIQIDLIGIKTKYKDLLRYEGLGSIKKNNRLIFSVVGGFIVGILLAFPLLLLLKFLPSLKQDKILPRTA